MSNSTATMWLERLPLSVVFRRPRCWLGMEPGRSTVGDIAKVMPWPPTSSYLGTIAKMKLVEKLSRVLKR